MAEDFSLYAQHVEDTMGNNPLGPTFITAPTLSVSLGGQANARFDMAVEPDGFTWHTKALSPAIGDGQGDFSYDISWSYAEAGARGHFYFLWGASNSPALTPYWDGAGKGLPPANQNTAGWWVAIADDGGGANSVFIGDGTMDFTNGPAPLGGGQGLPQGQVHYGTVAWNDITKTFSYTDYNTDSTRTTVAFVLSGVAGTDIQAGTGGWNTAHIMGSEDQQRGVPSGREQTCMIEDLMMAPAGPPTEIREVLNDSAGVPYVNGVPYHCYDSTGVLSYSGVVGTVTGANTTHASIVTPAAGEVVITFSNADVAQRYIVVDPSVDLDGLVTNLITPTQLV